MKDLTAINYFKPTCKTHYCYS